MIANPKIRANLLLPNRVKTSLAGVMSYIEAVRKRTEPDQRSKSLELSDLYDYADALACRMRYLSR